MKIIWLNANVNDYLNLIMREKDKLAFTKILCFTVFGWNNFMKIFFWQHQRSFQDLPNTFVGNYTSTTSTATSNKNNNNINTCNNNNEKSIFDHLEPTNWGTTDVELKLPFYFFPSCYKNKNTITLIAAIKINCHNDDNLHKISIM